MMAEGEDSEDSLRELFVALVEGMSGVVSAAEGSGRAVGWPSSSAARSSISSTSASHPQEGSSQRPLAGPLSL